MLTKFFLLRAETVQDSYSNEFPSHLVPGMLRSKEWKKQEITVTKQSKQTTHYNIFLFLPAVHLTLQISELASSFIHRGIQRLQANSTGK